MELKEELKATNCDMHELWLRILACIRFSNSESLDKFVNRLEKILSPDDIRYLIQYLKELGD